MAYISPEQTGRLNYPVDYRTDFYSMGITFFEILAGAHPFTGEDPLEWIHNHLAQTPPLISEINKAVPQQISLIIGKLLAKVPEDRYLSAAGLKGDLARCQLQWNAEQKISNFKLGELDVRDHLMISRKLYGRETEIAELLATFEKISKGSSELFLVAGYSGIGKSSLVNEIHKAIVERHGYFSSGKFEQFQRDVPYAALVQSFRKLVKQILSESQECLDSWRERILKAVGKSAEVIIQVIPEVELLIGKQPALAVLPPPQARNRFEMTFCDFVKCFTAADHPLVLFLDDLQWADMASLDLLLLLLRNAQIEYFMLIGTYRDNEVITGHPLLDVLHELEKAAIKIHSVKLAPLDLASIIQLLSDTLNVQDKTTELAALILEKTGGNPFFVNTFLMTLYEDKHLFFNSEGGQWKWSIDNIHQLAITNNVVDLLVTKIERLPETAQRLLEIAACLGNQFDLTTLAQVENKSQTEIAQALWPSLEINLLIPIGNNYKLAMANAEFELEKEKINYKFAHDRVQQAAYSIMSETKRKQTHLQLGRSLLKHFTPEQIEESVFDIVNHFNSAHDLVNTSDESLSVASLNIKAGEKAKRSTAYAPALGYFKYAIDLLGEDAWDKHYALAFTMYVEYAECQHLLGRYDIADPAFAEIIKKAKTKIDKAQISMLQVLSYTIQVKFDEAINVGLQGLNVFGVKISRNPSILQVTYELFKTMWAMRGQNLEAILALPDISDPEQKLLLDLVERIGIASYLQAPNLIAIFSLRSIRYSLKNGITPSVAIFYFLYAVTQIVGFNRFDYAYKIGLLANKIAEKYNDIRNLALCYFSTCTITYHWKKPYRDWFSLLVKSYNLFRQSGDLIYTNYSISLIPLIMLFKGDELSEVEIKVKSMKIIADFTRNIDGLSNLSAFIAIISILKGEKTHDHLQQLVNDYVSGVIQHSVPVAHANTGTLILMTCYVMESWDDAAKMFDKIKIYHNLQELSPTFINAEYTFYMGVTALNLYREATCLTKKISYFRWFKKALRRFKLWSKHCPENYLAKYLILLAGLKELFLQHESAMKLYEKAIISARENNLIHIEAAVFQQITNGLIKREQKLSAKLYLGEEIYAYTHWGAVAKCSYLEAQYPEWISNSIVAKIPEHSTVTTELPLASVNILSIFKFTQALSSEIQLDKLLQKLLTVLLQAAGAQRAILLVKNNEQWYVEGEGTSTEEKIYLTHQSLLVERTDLPLKLIQYVQRVQEILVIPTPQDSEPVTVEDSYLQDIKPKSLLILPIIYQGQLKSLLYLENRATRHTFNSEHIQTLKLLASQAAISLENARLYYQATHDPLTGIANRNLLYQLFTLKAAKAQRNKTQIAILFFDLDGFKKVNDNLGHEVGDKLLQYFATQLKNYLGAEDLTVRLGGDEFVMMLDNVLDIAQVSTVAESLLEALKIPVQILEHQIKIASSVGISLYPIHGDDMQTLLKKADIALYQVKAQGKGHFLFYKAEN